MNYSEIIDYTNLDDNCSSSDVELLCKKAIGFRVAAVCVWPKFVSLANELLVNSNVKVCTVVSFPEGTNSLSEKLTETIEAIQNGADEIDMVFNYRKLKQSFIKATIDEEIEKELSSEIEAVADLCHREGCILKVIIESGELSNSMVEYASRICIKGEADYIKTSTGKVSIGAEPEKVAIIRKIIDNLNPKTKIKISGGIRTIDDIKQYKAYNISRIGMGYASAEKLLG